MTWLPFDLHPEYPQQGIPRTQLVARYGDAVHERLRQSFAAAGLAYNPPPDVVPNTMRALCVTELARERGLHRQVHDGLMQAYWEEAVDIGDPDELLALATGAGLDEAEVVEAMEDPTLRERVVSTDRAGALDRGHGRAGVPPRPPAPRARGAAARGLRAGDRTTTGVREEWRQPSERWERSSAWLRRLTGTRHR